jgi:hypothetical protein
LTQAVQLRKFDISPTAGDTKPFETTTTIKLTDGGVYDNSGLTTAADFFEYLLHFNKVRRLILLFVDARQPKIERNTIVSISKPGKWQRFPRLTKRFPIPIFGLLNETVDVINNSNQERGEEIAWARLKGLADKQGIQVLYFPVALAQLSGDDAYRILSGASESAGEERKADEDEFISGGQKQVRGVSWDDVQGIATDLHLSVSESKKLRMAAESLTQAEQEIGWSLGPYLSTGEDNSIHRLDEAWSYALLRAQLKDWDDLPCLEPAALIGNELAGRCTTESE